MNTPLLGITLGDPSGISPEIVLKALTDEEPFRCCRPLVVGDEDVLLKTKQCLGLEAEIVNVGDSIPETGYTPGKIFVRPVSRLDADSITMGNPGKQCGEAMARYVEEAVGLVLSGKLDAITTCPINKKAMNDAGYRFPGHTEFIAHLAGVAEVAMMFVGSQLRVVLQTIHVPIREVADQVSVDAVLSKIELTAKGMKAYFGMERPRIAVLGLNPHCGEEDLLGEEERREIVPAIEKARAKGLTVDGPFAGDSFFGLKQLWSSYDAVVAMYHDQGLIPMKMMDFVGAANLTLGLPFVRTSVGHGTAYNIAGKGVADPTNLIRAISLAASLSSIQKKGCTKVRTP